ncbi:hypothetical protein [Streptomyces sp. NPDC026659]|uniref:hypothetical protein n=1 Tax=Streptomyces sp. NPDC026659 TaxID=3155123 RepID=UPI0033F14CA5
MKRIKAAVLTAAVVAGTVLAATPAQALNHCNRGTGIIICEYGVATVSTQRGVQYEFAIGTDLAAYARTRTSTTNWTDWSSLGGKWRSGIDLIKINGSYPAYRNIEFVIGADGEDGRPWRNLYAWDGTRTGWQLTPTDPEL